MLCGVLNCPGSVAGLAPRLDPVAVLVELRDARIDVAVADVDVAGGVPGHVGRPGGSWPSIGGSGGFGCFSGSVSSSDASCLRPNTIVTRPCGIELDDHVRALVGDPDVVVLVDAHGVRERPGVEVLADLAHELAVCVELEQLRGGRAIGRAGACCRAMNTKTWPFELTATPETSPKYMLGGSFRGSGTLS